MAANIRVIVIALRCPAPRSSGRTARNSAPGVARDESGTDPKSDRHFMVKLGFGECSIGKMLALPMRGVEGESARGCGIVTYQNQLKIRAFDGIGAPGRSIFFSGFNTENSEGGHREHKEIQTEREIRVTSTLLCALCVKCLTTVECGTSSTPSQRWRFL
jgi:hypothetical protein